MKNTILLFFVIGMISCSTAKMNKNLILIDAQGHRGCRGILPENTIEAFEKALELGVSTLEMDLVISKDHQVVVSHEPFFNHEISTAPNNVEITKENQLEHNLYNLSYEAIKTYDVGLKSHSRFPEQVNQQATKPLLKNVIKFAEEKSKKLNRPLPWYNVEIKRRPDADNIYHPSGKVFAELVVKTIQDSGIKDRIFIQSFDKESLQLAKGIDPHIKLVLLIENKDSPEQNLSQLGFTPNVYSPYFKLVNQELVDYCKAQNMALIPWTVNEEKDIIAMIEMGVDGIISDFPGRLVSIIRASDQHSVK